MGAVRSVWSRQPRGRGGGAPLNARLSGPRSQALCSVQRAESPARRREDGGVMATVLTLRAGSGGRSGNEQPRQEHPVEVARRALFEAAEIEEDGAWSMLYQQT